MGLFGSAKDVDEVGDCWKVLQDGLGFSVFNDGRSLCLFGYGLFYECFLVGGLAGFEVTEVGEHRLDVLLMGGCCCVVGFVKRW